METNKRSFQVKYKVIQHTRPQNNTRPKYKTCIILKHGYNEHNAIITMIKQGSLQLLQYMPRGTKFPRIIDRLFWQRRSYSDLCGKRLLHNMKMDGPEKWTGGDGPLQETHSRNELEEMGPYSRHTAEMNWRRGAPARDTQQKCGISCLISLALGISARHVYQKLCWKVAMYLHLTNRSNCGLPVQQMSTCTLHFADNFAAAAERVRCARAREGDWNLCGLSNISQTPHGITSQNRSDINLKPSSSFSVTTEQCV
jgi:hypothetical protein